MRYRPDPSTRLLPDGRTLIGGSPLRLFRLTAGGGRWFQSLVGGEDLDVPGPRGPEGSAGVGGALLRRLLDAGVVHPDPRSGPVDQVAGGAPPACTVVVPVRDRPEQLASLLESIDRAGGVAEVVVVDDGSLDAAAHEQVAERFGASYLRLERSRGPAAARDAGIRLAGHEVVVLVDSDVVVTVGWLEPLLAHLADPVVAAVAARVRTAADPAGSGRLAGYESRRSPLDLGDVPAPVAAGTRVAYVPAAALLLRRAAYLDVGGFDVELRFGEDVDLEWRLADRGWTVRYEPASVVFHPPRPDVGKWLRQRFEYGTAAAALDRRHPGSVAPWRASRWSLLVWLLVLAGHPGAALLVAGGTGAALARRLDDLPASEAVAMVGRGHLAAGRSLAGALVRTWWPLVLVGSCCSRRIRRAGALALVVAVLDRSRSAGAGGSPTDLPLGVLDDMAYGAGVWWGCVRHRRWGPLVPTLDP